MIKKYVILTSCGISKVLFVYICETFSENSQGYENRIPGRFL